MLPVLKSELFYLTVIVRLLQTWENGTRVKEQTLQGARRFPGEALPTDFPAFPAGEILFLFQSTEAGH